MRLRGVAAAPGAAVGPVWIYRAPVSTNGAGSPSIGLDEAAAIAADRLENVAAGVRGAGRPDDAEILEAQALMARDETLLSGARDLIAAAPRRPTRSADRPRRSRRVSSRSTTSSWRPGPPTSVTWPPGSSGR